MLSKLRLSTILYFLISYKCQYLFTTITSSQRKHIRSFRVAGPQNSYYLLPQSLAPQIHTIDTTLARPLTTLGRIGSTSVEVLIDAGSSLTLINYHLFNHLPPYLTRLRRHPSPFFLL